MWFGSGAADIQIVSCFCSQLRPNAEIYDAVCCVQFQPRFDIPRRGKTTLLNIVASLDKATSGHVVLDGMDLSKIKDKEISTFRRKNLGFVFQDFNLLDTFSIQDNIFLPLVLARKPFEEMKKRLDPIAKQLGITDILQKYPYEVSGGQKQRAAVARALITSPKLILADEPTGKSKKRRK